MTHKQWRHLLWIIHTFFLYSSLLIAPPIISIINFCDFSSSWNWFCLKYFLKWLFSLGTVALPHDDFTNGYLVHDENEYLPYHHSLPFHEYQSTQIHLHFDYFLLAVFFLHYPEYIFSEVYDPSDGNLHDMPWQFAWVCQEHPVLLRIANQPIREQFSYLIRWKMKLPIRCYPHVRYAQYDEHIRPLRMANQNWSHDEHLKCLILLQRLQWRPGLVLDHSEIWILAGFSWLSMIFTLKSLTASSRSLWLRSPWIQVELNPRSWR